jgi:tartronate-semialdehyde synthase
VSEDAGKGYGVDHVAVAEGLGCKAIRVRNPSEFQEAFTTAQALMREHRVPVVIEFILAYVTDIAKGADINAVVDSEKRSSDRHAGFARLRGEEGKSCRNLQPT